MSAILLLLIWVRHRESGEQPIFTTPRLNQIKGKDASQNYTEARIQGKIND
jgi:hypothetical protein